MNKRLIALFLCLAIAVTTIVLGTVVFTVQKIEVTVLSELPKELDTAKIVTDSGIKLKSSIFALSEKTATANIELQNPYAKVISIERSFPNKVLINVVERTGIFAVGVAQSNYYAVLDAECKVLEIVAKDRLNIGEITPVEGFTIVSDEPQKLPGLALAREKEIGALHESVSTLEALGFKAGRFNAFIRRAVFEGKFLVLHTAKGAKLAVYTNANVTAGVQLESIYAYFNGLSDAQKEKDAYLYISESAIVTAEKLPA